MSEGIEANEDESMPYWHAVIATLPAVKQNAAWDFYMKRIGTCPAGETLSGLILLLEANGIFMQALPQEFHAELILPMKETASGIKHELQQFAVEQRKTRESTERNLEAIKKLSQAIMLCGSEVRQEVQIAVQDISTAKIAQDIHSSLTESTLNALKSDLKELNAVSKQLEQSRGIAKHSVDLWNSIRIGGVVGCAAVFSVIFGAIFSYLFYTCLHRYYEKRLGEEIASIREEYEQNYLRGMPPR